MSIYKEQIDILEKQIIHLENLIEDNEEFVYEDEFETLNEAMLEKEQELDATLEYPFEDKMNDKVIEEISKQVKRFKKLKTRIKSIQDTAGKESEDDINSMMFPNDDDEI